MPDNDAISRERLDRHYSARAKQPLKRVQLALACEHQSHDLALRGNVAWSQHRH